MHRKIWRKENLNPKQLPPSPLHRKNETPLIHWKSPPRIAPKILIPTTYKDTIHRDLQESDPNTSASSAKTKKA